MYLYEAVLSVYEWTESSKRIKQNEIIKDVKQSKTLKVNKVQTWKRLSACESGSGAHVCVLSAQFVAIFIGA